jgi:hypothetical protein
LTVSTSPDRGINVFDGFWQGGEKNGQLTTGSADGVSPPLNRNVTLNFKS